MTYTYDQVLAAARLRYPCVVVSFPGCDRMVMIITVNSPYGICQYDNIIIVYVCKSRAYFVFQFCFLIRVFRVRSSSSIRETAITVGRGADAWLHTHNIICMHARTPHSHKHTLILIHKHSSTHGRGADVHRRRASCGPWETVQWLWPRRARNKFHRKPSPHADGDVDDLWYYSYHNARVYTRRARTCCTPVSQRGWRACLLFLYAAPWLSRVPGLIHTVSLHARRPSSPCTVI